MHENNIESLRAEALRLINMEKQLFSEMLASEGVITEREASSRQTFDRSSAEKTIEMLSGEATKLEHLDMVLAVVGTMKAGKSTTINAIVGTEVLPNRNAPMTALPTLIRHTRGQLEPRLVFANNAPLQKLMEQLRERIAAPQHKEDLDYITETREDLGDLIKRVSSGEAIGNLYQGANAIFDFLIAINDLVRLSPEFGLDFPFTDYDEVHELPVIEVEFAHLKGMDDTQGRLTLLDTPGPNEAGQTHLRKMLREQLQKASAVLAVLDYTQLKSDADQEVRAELSEIASVANDRIYVLVNKFDQKDRNGMNESEVRNFVKGLMDGSIHEDRIYPVSSKLGYLANRVRHEFALRDKLPDAQENAWVEDFGTAALGALWEHSIDDMERVKAAAEQMWAVSRYQAPLDGVIRTAHANAAIIALSSASSKLDDVAERTQNLLETRFSAMAKETKELEGLIKNIQSDIDKVGEAENLATKNAAASMKAINKEIREAFNGFRDEVEKAVDTYFNEGKAMVATSKKKRSSAKKDVAEKKQRNGLFSFAVAGLFGGVQNQNSDIDFDPLSTLLQFDSKSEATSLIEKIQKSLTEIMTHAESDISTIVDSVMQRFEQTFSEEVISASEKIIQQTKSTLEKEGFNLVLSPPKSAVIRLNVTSLDIIEKSIRSKTKTETFSRRKSGVWGTVCKWFGTTDWGWEDYQEEVEYYEVDIKKIRKAALKNVDDILTDLNENIATQIKQPLDESMEVFFSDLKAMIERIRGDLIQGLKDKQLSQEKKGELLKNFKGLKNKAAASKRDSKALRDEVAVLAPQAE